MIRNIITLFIIICIYSTFNSCEYMSDGQHEAYDSVPMQKISLSDHLLLLHTAFEFMINSHENFHNYEELWGSDLDQVIIEIDRVFYSPDKLKMIAWIVFKVPNDNDCDKQGQDHSYSGRAMIGYRESKNEIWRLFSFGKITPVCYSSKESVRNAFSKYYFVEMKDRSTNVNRNYLNDSYGGEIIEYDINMYGTAKSDRKLYLVSKKYGYNLHDKDFWDRSLIWQKGARIPGYYNFETLGNVLPSEKDVLYKTLKIDYPDYILNMYKENKE